MVMLQLPPLEPSRIHESATSIRIDAALATSSDDSTGDLPTAPRLPMKLHPQSSTPDHTKAGQEAEGKVAKAGSRPDPTGWREDHVGRATNAVAPLLLTLD